MSGWGGVQGDVPRQGWKGFPERMAIRNFPAESSRPCGALQEEHRYPLDPFLDDPPWGISSLEEQKILDRSLSPTDNHRHERKSHAHMTELEWMLLNEITYKIHALAARQAAQQFLELLRCSSPTNSASSTAGRKERLLRDPGPSTSPWRSRGIRRLRDLDYTRWIFIRGKNMAYGDRPSSGPKVNRPESTVSSCPHGIHYSSLSLASTNVSSESFLYRQRARRFHGEGRVHPRQSWSIWPSAVPIRRFLTDIETFAVRGKERLKTSRPIRISRIGRWRFLSLILKGLYKQGLPSHLFISVIR
jgi:hypothetical protein